MIGAPFFSVTVGRPEIHQDGMVGVTIRCDYIGREFHIHRVYPVDFLQSHFERLWQDVGEEVKEQLQKISRGQA